MFNLRKKEYLYKKPAGGQISTYVRLVWCVVCGLVWCGVVCGLVWCDVWCCVVWCGVWWCVVCGVVCSSLFLFVLVLI